jgi:hypothetical protein
MEKVIRDGKVAVLYSTDYGSGWYTWNGIQALMYDPGLVELVLNNASSSDILEYCEKEWGIQLHGRPRLAVAWVSLGARFIIEEYDGMEIVRLESDVEWLTA